MAIALDPKQLVSFEKLPMSQAIQQESLTRLLVRKGDLHQAGVLEMVTGG